MNEWKYAFPILVQISEAGQAGLSKNSLAHKYSLKELTNAMHYYADQNYIVIIPIIDETTALVDATYRITELGKQYIQSEYSIVNNHSNDTPQEESNKVSQKFTVVKPSVKLLKKIIIDLIVLIIGGILLDYILTMLHN